MFTGIVETKGTVASFQPNAFGARLLIDPGAFGYKPMPGDSIAVNGVCLTHAPRDAPAPGNTSSGVAASAATLQFDVIKETLERTNLGKLTEGSPVNLEASLRADTPIAGHFVQGHVDGVGTVTDVRDGSDEWRTTIEAPADLMPYIVPKGSITIDGISLTIATTQPATRQFSVALIPTTLELTTLGDAGPGRLVNLESDIIARTVVNYLQHHGGAAPSNLTIDKLREAGF